jgi:3-hydroxyacyl-[acyl-carrier-protein] dehydratase
MLQGNFFDISHLETTASDVSCLLTINAGHKIFEGHFPGQPVVPGVCLMQMVKELFEQVLGKKMNLQTASEMKFLAVINPQENNIIQATLKSTTSDSGNIQASAVFFKDALIHFKFKGLFAPAE